jgi:small subunit ribosomal protein S1
MLNHDQNTVEPEVKETEPVVEPVLESGADATSKSTVEGDENHEEPSIAAAEPEVESIEETPVSETETVVPEPEQLPTEEEPLVNEEEPIVEEPAMEEPVIEEPTMEEEPIKPEPPARELTQAEMEHEAQLAMYEESFSNFKKGEIIEGTIVDISDKEVRVDIGFKSEGVIPISEFAYSGMPERNTVVKVFINEIENGEGKLLLSKKKADYNLNIERIKKSFAEGTSVSGVIRRRVKGGMIVDILGIEGFLPGSQMSLKPIPNLDQFIGKELSFKVVNVDEEHRNIILSRRQVLEEEAGVKRQELLGKLEIDSEIDGEVKNITQYGAFIDLGGIDGLLHLTDMSWGKISHPSEMLQIGDKVKVKVINFDPETNKISLGLKQLVPHPWETIGIKYPEGTHIAGKVVSVKSFGAFVEIEPGVEGLVHISEMSWTKKISDARKMLKVGDTINAIVLELDKENKRISLGMKQMDANPWLTIEERYPMGTVLTRKVKSLTAFGAFVEIEEGIDGLIHISDISWTKRIYHPREVYRKNQDVEAIILSIDRAQHRIALGVKQLVPDPWESLNQVLPVNTEVKGKISKLIPKGLLVDVPMGNDVVEGFIPISHLALPKLERSEDAFHMGEELPLKVIELDMENRRLILSVKAFFFSRDPKLQEEYIIIHEQFMREKAVKQQKKKQEKEARDKQQAERKDEDDATETIPETDDTFEASASAAMETEVIESEANEAAMDETPVVEETVVEEIPEVEEAPVVEEIPLTEEASDDKEVPEVEEVPVVEETPELPEVTEIPTPEVEEAVVEEIEEIPAPEEVEEPKPE